MGKPILYVGLHKALYVTLIAVYIFWKTLWECAEIGFCYYKVYDSCAVNKIIERDQFTMVWNVEECWWSEDFRFRLYFVDKFIDFLDSEFGTEATMTTTWGKKHDHLEINLDYLISRRCRYQL